MPPNVVADSIPDETHGEIPPTAGLKAYPPITDGNVLKAIQENWVLPPTTRSSSENVREAPRNAYEKFMFDYFLKDTRDLEVFHTQLVVTLTLVPSAFLLLFWKTTYLQCALHLVMFGVLARKWILGLHVQSHRPIFKNHVGLLNYWYAALSPFVGSTWFTYYVHHVKMHHVTDNGPEDISTTLFYQRDNVFHFIHYFCRFLFFVSYDICAFFIKRGQYSKVGLVAFGELSAVIPAVYWSMQGNLLAVAATFWIPFAVIRFGMMQGNWTQHAFLERNDPLGGGMQNAIIVVDCPYNKECFNDGYHVSHHLNPLRHWKDLPEDFIRRRAELYAANAVCFRNHSYETIWWCLMTGDWDTLARDWVHLGTDKRPSDEAIKKMLKEKVRRFSKEEIDRAVERENAGKKQ